MVNWQRGTFLKSLLKKSILYWYGCLACIKSIVAALFWMDVEPIAVHFIAASHNKTWKELWSWERRLEASCILNFNFVERTEIRVKKLLWKYCQCNQKTASYWKLSLSKSVHVSNAEISHLSKDTYYSFIHTIKHLGIHFYLLYQTPEV